MSLPSISVLLVVFLACGGVGQAQNANSCPCLNGGSCVTSSASTVSCSCPSGFAGVKCEIKWTSNSNPCASGMCRNGGTCISRGGSTWNCQCPSAFTGQYCENSVSQPNPCTSVTCNNGGECKWLTGDSWICVCRFAYTGRNCEKSTGITQCPGCMHGRCPGFDDSFEYCNCQPGYAGQRCDIDVTWKNPCYTQTCRNGGACIWFGDEAMNWQGNDVAWKCSCPYGYAGRYCELGDGTDACLKAPCQNGGTCTTYDGATLYCRCREGYFGDRCETDNTSNNPCQSVACLNGGTCRWDSWGYQSCECTGYFNGKNCEKEGINYCTSGTCLNSGTCKEWDFDYHCECQPNFSGNQCQLDNRNSPCRNVTCKNGGMCQWNGGATWTCSCPYVFTGRYCETKISSPCNPSPCLNGGSCVISGSSFVCSCPTGSSGARCESIAPCSAKPCHNGGMCIDTPNDYQCYCARGYMGRQCDTNINECASSPCAPRATCVDLIGEFSCVCPAGLTGTLCEKSSDKCTATGRFPDESDCTSFFECASVGGKKERVACSRAGGLQLYYDTETRLCYFQSSFKKAGTKYKVFRGCTPDPTKP